jgi:hypothetical protein
MGLCNKLMKKGSKCESRVTFFFNNAKFEYVQPAQKCMCLNENVVKI